MTRLARQGSQITNVEESAGSTSLATVVWWTRVAPARCTESATAVRPPARARLQERGLLGRSQRSTTIISEQKLHIFIHVQKLYRTTPDLFRNTGTKSTTCLRWVQCSPTNRLSSGWSQPKVLTLAALCDMNNTLFLTLAAVSWDESVHLPRLFVLATL